MRKTIVALIVICIMVCGCSNNANPVTTMKIPEYTASSKIMQEYIKMKNDNIVPKDIIEFLDKNIDKVSIKEASDLIADLLDVLVKNISNYSKKVKGEKFNLNETDGKTIQLVNTDVQREIWENGYVMEQVEGLLNVNINYSMLKDKYNRFMNEELIEYFQIMDQYIKDKVSAFNYGTSQIDVLADMIVKIEKYIDKYPGSLRIDEIKLIYEEYIKAYLDNFKVFNTPGGQISSEYLNSYQKTIDKYKDTRLTRVLIKYIDVLKRSNYVKTEEVNSFTNNINAKIQIEEAPNVINDIINQTSQSTPTVAPVKEVKKEEEVKLVMNDIYKNNEEKVVINDIKEPVDVAKKDEEEKIVIHDVDCAKIIRTSPSSGEVYKDLGSKVIEVEYDKEVYLGSSEISMYADGQESSLNTRFIPQKSRIQKFYIDKLLPGRTYRIVFPNDINVATSSKNNSYSINFTTQ